MRMIRFHVPEIEDMRPEGAQTLDLKMRCLNAHVGLHFLRHKIHHREVQQPEDVRVSNVIFITRIISDIGYFHQKITSIYSEKFDREDIVGNIGDIMNIVKHNAGMHHMLKYNVSRKEAIGFMTLLILLPHSLANSSARS